jgi:AcrR family transcriptional regulator
LPTVADDVRPIRDESRSARPGPKVRMSGQERRLQLIDVGRRLFAERGYEATSIEEIANHAGVSKPVVYEHFGGKEGLYEVVVDLEVQRLLARITTSLTAGEHPRVLLERAANALLGYIEDEPHGFRILVRDSPVTQSSGTFASLIVDITSQVEHLLGAEFGQRGYDPELAPIYSQALVGMVALVGQWWLDARQPSREQVAAHLVNLAWNGLSRLDPTPLKHGQHVPRRRVTGRAQPGPVAGATG